MRTIHFIIINLISFMDCILREDQRYETQLNLLKKLDKITLYDHNSVIKKDFQNLSFSCVLNCKRLNRQYSIIGKVEGDLLSNSIQISCALVDFKRIVAGRWQHQKIQLTKFAYRYNQKSGKTTTSKITEDSNSYQIKVNPLSGQFYVCYHFLLGYDLIKDCDKFKMKMTDQCQKLTSEAQKIFNTIIEVIFDQEANDPYLKSDERVGMHFSRPVKVGKLLKKIKKLNTISNNYKIKNDISVQNKQRSKFKKFFLKRTQKVINNQLIIQNAILFIPKFCKKHLDAIPENVIPAKKKSIIISPFEDLQDNLQIQYATRHLDNSKIKTGSPIIEISGLTFEERNILSNVGIHKIRDHMFLVEELPRNKKKYEYEILNKINYKYLHICQYYKVSGEEFFDLRISEYVQNELSLEQFMKIYGYTISLSTRLDIMTQICHVVEVLHKLHIGYFLDYKNIFITDGNIVKIRDFTSAYSLSCWDETEKRENNDKKYLMEDWKNFVNVAGFAKEQINQTKDRIQEEEQKQRAKFENQRADVFSLGMALYKILLDKFPFSPNCVSILEQNYKRVEQFLNQIWLVQTEYFLRQGGMVVKLLSQLLLKCLHMQIQKRPYVEWITVILSEVKSSLECLY